MSSWGVSFGPCSGGSGEAVIVEAIRDAIIISTTSANAEAASATAEILNIVSATSYTQTATAEIANTCEA